METPKPMPGTWTLTAPDGRTWQAESPLHCVRMEQRERVPADVALKRILDFADEPTEEEKRLTSELEKAKRLLRDFGDIITNHSIAMQSALIEAEHQGAEKGLVWISNTLFGPGLLPDVDEARALSAANPAQAWFDAKTAEHEALRAKQAAAAGAA